MNAKKCSDFKLTAISPLDGRYHKHTTSLQHIFSEYGLIKQRLHVEIQWCLFLAQHSDFSALEPLSDNHIAMLNHCLDNFDLEQAMQVKQLEQQTKHDVKAVEYYLAAHCKQHQCEHIIPFLHFALTSEDVNNLSYALMLQKNQSEVIQPLLENINNQLNDMSTHWAKHQMLAHTHGQPASPTTVGKEFKNFQQRLQRQLHIWQQQPILAKWNGATGNFHAHTIAYPEANWPALSQQFIESFGLSYNTHTTQIEPHDYMAEMLHTLMRINNIMIDFCQDIWGYISLGYFSQKKIDNEVGSSTMPHKINPIDFENAEGNCGLSNALAQFMADKLTKSRWQRDLSDSTVLRNLGCVFGYAVLAYQNVLKGMDKLILNEQQLHDDLEPHWEILTEAIQSVMRRHGIADAYQQLKDFSRGNKLSQQDIQQFIHQLDIPDQAKQDLLQLTPKSYVGLAIELANSKDN